MTCPRSVFTLDADNRSLDLERQSIGMTIRSGRAVIECIEAALFVEIEDFVSGDPRETKLTAQQRHLLAI